MSEEMQKEAIRNAICVLKSLEQCCFERGVSSKDIGALGRMTCDELMAFMAMNGMRFSLNGTNDSVRGIPEEDGAL